MARVSAEVVAMAQPGGSLDFLLASDGWREMHAAPGGTVWTDARSDIVRQIRLFGRDLTGD
jgi:hypothetical protein